MPFGDTKNRWGDEDDDEGVLPEPTETAEDAKGFKTRTEYKYSETEEKVKVTKKIRVIRTQVKVSKRVEERRKRLQKFGRAKDSTDESNVTMQYSEVKMLHPKVAEAEEDESTANITKAIASSGQKKAWRKFQDDLNSSAPPLSSVPEEGGGQKSDVFVVPALRGAGGSSLAKLAAASAEDPDKEHKIIRVSNLSDNTKEADLQTLFERFGRVQRIYLAKDKETMRSRGFAFVTFFNKEDAERAMDKLQGWGYDHLILKLEWARPSTRDPSAQPSGGFRSGYGKALAQDTKQQVSYASNLTTGTR